MANINLRIITPEKTIKNVDVDMVVAPGSEGEFGILPNHVSFLSSLNPGEIKLYNKNKISERIFIAHGFCEVHADTCIILTEEIIKPDSYTKAELEKEIQNKSSQLTKAQNEGNHIQAGHTQKEIERLQACLHYKL
jgi:F-type H+-transporting ATPase subunit epsilon